MALRLHNVFTFENADPGKPSRDPYGRPDVRWQNSTPPKLRATLEIEFEDTDWVKVRELLRLLGTDLPYR